MEEKESEEVEHDWVWCSSEQIYKIFQEISVCGRFSEKIEN